MRSLLFIATSACVLAARIAVPTYTINLDLPPEHRFDGLVHDFNASVWKFYNDFFANDKALTDVLYGLSDKRGPEPSEMQAEIEGVAARSKLPLKFVQGIQMLYELQTLMVPIENVTGREALQFALPPELKELSRIPWRGPGCTGIIAKNTNDGTVYHARNLDFSPLKYMQKLVYTGVFTKAGKEVFRSQMVAGYSCVVTGMRMGSNGYTIERNTRYPSSSGGNEEMFHNLLEAKRPLNGWSLRKILENASDYEDAVHAVSTVPYVSTEYAIMAGVQKGTILSRDPDATAYTQTLGQANFEEPGGYIIMTNFDFFFHDLREWFDPTGGKLFHPRRIAAQKMLNQSSVLTAQVLFNTINAKGVIADTIFQAIMNVELNLWNVSNPNL